MVRPAGELMRAVARRVDVSGDELREAMLDARPDQMHPTITVRYARYGRAASVRPGTILWDTAYLLHVEPEELRDAIAEVQDLQPGHAVTLSAWRSGVRKRPPKKERKPPPDFDYHERGINRTPPRLRKFNHGSGHISERWVRWCGWCRQDHTYSIRYTAEQVVSMHADHIEHICKPKALDREARV